MKWKNVLNVHNLAKAIVSCFIGLAFFLLMWPYWMEDDGVFEVTDPSQVYLFEDSSRASYADVVEASIVGYLDGTASVEIYYPDATRRVWTYNFQPGRIDSSGRWDFYDRKVRIDYIPGTAKKGYLKIVTKVF
ncbi:hypothetical protein [Dyadobacter fermentans]|uniref:Uncharacterized protein n=1 Tax=Dyadobacter fermentans (strain ATCC 700827 / DSM 18053 / CIP 107007 / KCTC 52180 / NS114) TaxID=471854 RepID=C6W6W0_DYAFD|nr:hypothetical protein [Dyadobacter fermentans]ACT96171.1 hypothetical protein Dfer_4971 [Dyadobacter fermentans DSM 18053]